MADFFEELGEWCELSLLKMQKRMNGLRKSWTKLNLPHATIETTPDACENQVRDAFEQLPELPPYKPLIRPEHGPERDKGRKKKRKRKSSIKEGEKKANGACIGESEGTKEMPIEIDVNEGEEPATMDAPATQHPTGKSEENDCIVIDEDPIEDEGGQETRSEGGGDLNDSNPGPSHGPSGQAVTVSSDEDGGDDQLAVAFIKQPLPPEVEEQEWKQRDRVIAAQRSEAVRQKAAIRMQSRQEEQLLKYRRDEEEKNRMNQDKERMRWLVKKDIDHHFGSVLKLRKLRDLLIGLGVPTEGDLTKALRLAKIRFHPDKASGKDLKSRVFSEEISKILNSWTL